jgi:transposase
VARSRTLRVSRDQASNLVVHIVMDNYGTHKTKPIRNWFAKRPRWHVHFTPTSASWINQVERFFALLTERALLPTKIAFGPATGDE